MQQPVLLSTYFRANSSHIFTQPPENVTVVCGTDCLACHDKFFAINPLYVKNDEHALGFRSSPASSFSVSVSVDTSTGRTVALSQGRNRKPSYRHQRQHWARSLLAFLVGAIAKSHQARYMTPNKRT
jgi:hypothetical protein